MERLVTTPFGARPVTAGLRKSLARVEEARPALASVDKWHLLRELCAARAAFGVTDRELGVLEGLLSFLPGQQLGGNAELIVFPSNRALSERCHGMAESTLRRHLARLVASGLLLRHDSPNGKRYAARDGDGALLRAFGFDLSPLLIRAPEIAQAAQAARDAALRLKTLRETISLQKRDAQKLALYGLESGFSGGFETVLSDLLDVTRELRRKLTLEELEALAPRVGALRDAVIRDLSHAEELSATHAQSERQYQNSNTDSSDLEPCLEKARAEPSHDMPETADEATSETDIGSNSPEDAAQGLPLPLILKALPNALEYQSGPVRRVDDLFRLGAYLRGMLGISAHAFEEAVRVMGPATAGITICCLVERVEDIRSPGGYLRHLTREAEAGRYSLARLIMAQIQRPEPMPVQS